MKKRIQATIGLAFMLGVPIERIVAADDRLLPRFEDFRVRTPLPRRSTPAIIGRRENATNAQFNRRIREAANEGPNFAGHYVVVEWSCGLPCVSFVLADVRTGNIYYPRFSGVGHCGPLDPRQPQLLSFQLESRLLIVRGSPEIDDSKTQTFSEGPCRTYYYLWNGNSLKLVRSAP